MGDFIIKQFFYPNFFPIYILSIWDTGFLLEERIGTEDKWKKIVLLEKK